MSSRVIALGLLLCAWSATAQRVGALEGKRIAVLEFQSGKGVSLQSPETLSDECRGGVVEMVRGEGAIVLTRENMLEVLKATGGKCVEGECEVETARNLGVDYFVTGALATVDGKLMLTLKAYETRTGGMLGKERISASREGELIDLTQPATAKLVRDAFGLGKGKSAAVKVQPTVQLGSFGEEGKEVVVEEGEEVLVKFESEPAGATVSVEGELLCQSTPCSKRIASGRYEVVFQKERYSAARLDGVATRGAVVRGTLQPKFGWLTVETEAPGISVTVNGIDAGKTPVVAREVDPGTVEVAVSDACYVRTGERIAIQAGERRTLALRAKPKMAGLKVSAVDGQGNDLEATVRVDGKDVGEVGATLKVPVCSREVSVDLGTRQWRASPNLKEGEVTVLTARVSSDKPVPRSMDSRSGHDTLGSRAAEQFAVLAGAVQVKPSFPCEKATTQTERAICATPELARLDNRLAELYAARRATNPGIKRSQLEFLGRLRQCNGSVSCIQSLQGQRVGELEDLGP